MKHLSIDLGEKRIGIAVSDPRGIIAQPFDIIKRISDKETLLKIKSICSTEKIEVIVVGIPLSGNEKTQLRFKSFARKVKDATEIPVHLWDETFSTKQAQNMVAFSDVRSTRKKTKDHRDDVAAAIILQEFLDHEKST